MKTSISLLFTLLIFAGSSTATERSLGGNEIKEFLPLIAAKGSNSYQTFNKDGNTNYSSGGRPSSGMWEVRGDQYCSVWPPSVTWACYGVVVDEEEGTIYWIDAKGLREKNTYELRS